MTELPHGSPRIVAAGAAPESARLGLVLLHGRGGSAEDILRLGLELGHADIACVAPEADGNSWWPTSFLAPEQQLAPWRDGALRAVQAAVAALARAGIPAGNIAVAGFSQGACLALEYVARTGGPVHSVHAFSGALLGTGDAGGAPRADLYGHSAKHLNYNEKLTGVPIFLGCHEADPHIPVARVRESAEVLSKQGAITELEVYPGAGHMLMPTGFAAMQRRLGA